MAACGVKVNEPSDKNTNWLRQCSASTECGAGLLCMCDVCTSICDRDEQCSAQDPNAVCTAFAGPRCESAVPAVCSVRCEDSTVCGERNDDLVCVKSVCEPRTLENPGTGPAMDGGKVVTDSGGPSPDAGEIGATAPIPDMSASATLSDATLEAVAEGCGPAFVCEARTAYSGNVLSLAVDEATVAWADFGSADELGNHRSDGAIVRMAKAGGVPERVHGRLDRPFRLWIDGSQYYWLSGDPADFSDQATSQGLQALYQAPQDASAAPALLRMGPLGGFQIRNGASTWLQALRHEALGEGVQVWFALLEWADGSASEGFLAGGHKLYTFDGTAVYLGQDITRIQRWDVQGGAMMEILSDPPAWNAVLDADGDRLWLIHRDRGGVEWLSWMPQAGGAITHVAGDNGIGTDMKPGTAVVWGVKTAEGDSREWELWSVPKAGGDPTIALRWPFEDGDPLPLPVWTADGDEAWVFGHGAVIAVSRP